LKIVSMLRSISHDYFVWWRHFLVELSIFYCNVIHN